MHNHDYTIHRIDPKPTPFGKYGYLYSRCECATVLGSPIKTKQQLKAIEEMIRTHVSDMGEGFW